MPIHERERNGKKEYRWGEHGAWVDSREKAEEIMRAAYANGYAGDALPFAFDATARTYDTNGWLHISRSHITKAAINPYYGREIPNNEELGLDPNHVYYMLRDPEELRRAAPTFARIPILNKHIVLKDFNSMEEKEKKKYIVGAVGSDVEFLEPYLDADTSIWDADSIAGIETDIQREFSCCYRYVPIMTTGIYAGQKYDGIMTQIEANHLALVESGRAGNDVLAADNKLENEPMKRSKLGNSLIVALTTAFPTLAADKLEATLANARRKTFEKSKAADTIMAMDANLDRRQVEVVMDALVDVDDPEPTKKDNEEPEPAEDETPEEKEEREKREKEAKDKAAKDKAAKDKEKGDEPVTKEAMDSALAAQREQFRQADQAKRDVRAVVGEVVAMDSAAEIYGFALDQMSVDHKGISDVNALKAIFKLAESNKQAAVNPVMAMDADSVTDAIKRFPGLGRIRQA